jgi:hypothetical protein
VIYSNDAGFTRNQRRVARLAFLWRRAGVRGAVFAGRGTVAEVEQWNAIRPRRHFWATTLLCPAFVADSRSYAIGFTDGGVAVIQWEPSRIPQGRRLRFYELSDLEVTSTTLGPFTAVYVGDELFQVGAADAAALTELLRRTKLLNLG